MFTHIRIHPCHSVDPPLKNNPIRNTTPAITEDTPVIRLVATGKPSALCSGVITPRDTRIVKMRPTIATAVCTHPLE